MKNGQDLDEAPTNALVEPGKSLLTALRRNQRILGELAARYEIDTQPRRSTESIYISEPEDVRRLVQDEMEHLAQEQVRVLLLNKRNRLIGQRVVYHGNAYSCVVRAGEVYRPAVIESAPAIIMVHNHPSGVPEPSPEDVAITQTIVEAGRLLDIELLDHVVIGSPGIVSFKERGLIRG